MSDIEAKTTKQWFGGRVVLLDGSIASTRPGTYEEVDRVIEELLARGVLRSFDMIPISHEQAEAAIAAFAKGESR